MSQDLDSRILLSPDSECLHDVFGRQVREVPSAVAAVRGDEALTYGELDGLANRLSRRLAALGAGPGTQVAICAEPSLALLVAIFGVLKAGAAYVPLDPDYPAERLAYLLADSAARIVVAERDLADRLPTGGAHVVVLDPAWQVLAGETDTPLGLDLPPDGAACVIYSSGSTGSPKGVLVTHRGLTNLALAAAEEFGLLHGDRFLQLSSISFSAVLEEIFPPLLSGGTVVLAGYRRALGSIPDFVALLERERIAGFEITAAYWHQLVDELVATGTTLPASVRFVVVGGDRARPEQVLRWREFGIPLIHVYGPTEATATGSYHNTAKEVPHPEGLLPIGRAIANTRLHLLGTGGAPVPDGATGEIFIGGAALAQGYHGAPGKTAESFLPDPFGPPGGRLYRTGDLACRLADGTLEFLGRVDDQIKLRGFRIEPAEIELALQRHPGVRQALVTLGGDLLEDQHLVAYVTAAPEAPGDTAMQAHLAAILPAHMVPAVYVVVDGMPLTPNGKIDRAALPALGADRPGAAGEFVAPRPGTETEVAAVWADVLKREQVGRADDLFAIGGNSLQAVLIVARTRRRFGVEVRPNDLLKEPTVAAFAAEIDRLGCGEAVAADDGADELDMKRWRNKRRLLEKAMAARAGEPRVSLVSVSQQNLWLLSKFLPDIPLYNEAWQCRLDGPLDLDAFRHAFGRIIDRHETWRTRFDMVDGQPVQVVSGAGELPLEYHEPSGTPQDRLAAAYAVRDEAIVVPLAPTRQPLLRAWLFRLASDDHLLLMNMHHLVWDGISKEVFLDELVAFYQAARTGTEPSLPPLPLQYGDFALWQRDHLTGANLERLLDYWRGRLADPPPPLELPTDRPVPATQDYAGAKVVLPLPPELRARVVDVGRRENVTPFMVLFTALCSQLHRRTGQTDLCVGTPVANRTRPGIESLIGCFINSVALRVDVSGDPTYRQVLEQVRSGVLEAVEHQALPFDKLVEELRPARHAGRNPLFQVWFATEDDTLLPRESPGLSIDAFEDLSTGLSNGMAKLDLNWIVVDRGDEYVLSISYRTSMFDEATVRSLTEEFQTVLEELVDDPGAAFAAPAAADEPPVADRLLGLWQQAFGDDGIGVHDDFFELGGYSMLAVEIVTRIHEDFGVEVSFTDFFESPTVAEIAEIIVATATGGGSTAAPALRSGAERTLDEILAEVEQLSS